MPPNAYRDRMFPPAEVRRILRRAAELEDETRPHPPEATGRGHTLDEIERIAGDAGIGESALRRAIDGEAGPEKKEKKKRQPWSFTGAPGRVSIERTVHGNANATNHGKLAKAMRGAVGELGNAQAVGDSLSWSSTTAGGRSVYAIVEPEGDGRVTIRVDENLRALRGGLFGGIMGGGGGGGSSLVVGLVAAAEQPALIPFVLVAWFLLMYLLARTIYVSRFRAREAELAKLVDDVAALVEAGGPRVTAQGDEANVGTRVAEKPREEALADDGDDDGSQKSEQPRRAAR